MGARVECRSDWEYAQHPLAFTWQGRRLLVKAILTEQQTPAGKHFLVSTSDDGNYELIYEQHLDQWTIQPQPAKESA